jgi:hypothetical protein
MERCRERERKHIYTQHIKYNFTGWHSFFVNFLLIFRPTTFSLLVAVRAGRVSERCQENGTVFGRGGQRLPKIRSSSSIPFHSCCCLALQPTSSRKQLCSQKMKPMRMNFHLPYTHVSIYICPLTGFIHLKLLFL